MNQPTAVVPRPMFGFLAPGESRTRKFPALPKGIMPIVQNFPNGSVRLVEQGPDFVTIENYGNNRSGFTVLFVTQLQLKKLMALKQVVDVISESRRKK